MADSLFEGMVLFSPSDLHPSSSPAQNQPPTSTPQDHLQPLDEHFFSDPSLQSPPVAQSCNISRKKKRSSRIGYAREAPDASETVLVLSAEAAKDGDALEVMEERLNLFRSAISAKYDGIRKTAALAYSERKELERRRRKAGRDVDKASLVYRELEQQVEVACEAEDFETAEKVSECLAAAEEEKDRLIDALRETEIGCDCFDLRMQELFDLQIVAEEEGVECLENFAKV